MNGNLDLVVGYMRVSTTEQGDTGYGLAAQQAAIEQACAQRNWRLVRLERDVASGKSTDSRPGLASALELVRGDVAGTLMVAKLDRLSRSLADFSRLMVDARKQRWNLVALDLGVDLSTPSGEFLANVMASIAQWERSIIGQRTSEALRAAQARGVQVGRARMIPPDVRARIVAERRRGTALSAIASGLNRDGVPTAAGGRKWYASTVQRVLEQEQG